MRACLRAISSFRIDPHGESTNIFGFAAPVLALPAPLEPPAPPATFGPLILVTATKLGAIVARFAAVEVSSNTTHEELESK